MCDEDVIWGVGDFFFAFFFVFTDCFFFFCCARTGAFWVGVLGRFGGKYLYENN